MSRENFQNINKYDYAYDFDGIRSRIDLDIGKIKVKDWAGKIGVSKSLISNIHGKSHKQNPPLPYVLAVARFTGKPVEWYLYGKTIATESPPPDSIDQVPDEIRTACRQCRDILLSKHETIKPALLSNLAAFHSSMHIEAAQKQENEKLKDKNVDLNRRLTYVEQQLQAKQCTGTDEAASSSIGKTAK